MYGALSSELLRNEVPTGIRQDPYIFYSQSPIYLGGRPGSERIVFYTTPSGTKAMVQIQKYDDSSGQWIVEYRKEALGMPHFLATAGYWELLKHNVVVLYYSTGSGELLHYTVVGREKNKIVEFVQRNEIFQGSLWFDGGNLIEGYGIRARVWVKKNQKLTLVPYSIPLVPDAVFIEFSIRPGGKVHIGQTHYKAIAGSTVQLIRTDLNDILERVLYNYSPEVQYIPHRNALKVNTKGNYDITIFPDGYNWDQSVNLTIEVV